MITSLAVWNYRSLRDLVIPLGRLTVITGANGTGKSSLYRSLRLMADVAQGRVVASLAREGGLESALWAGPEVTAASVRRGEGSLQGTIRKKPVRLRLGFAGDELGYLIDLGPPQHTSAAFERDPEIRREWIFSGPKAQPSTILAEREHGVVRVRDGGGQWQVVTDCLGPFDSMVAECADPRSAPELTFVRDQLRAWRFYDQLRTDMDAPARRSQVATWTPVLSGDGGDVASAVETIARVGDRQGFDNAIADAFPNASVGVEALSGGRLEVSMHQDGLLRPLGAPELSDGTLRYILVAAAVFTPRPPPLLVFNEPETSVHPRLLAAMGRLIARAATNSQVIVVSHAAPLIKALEGSHVCRTLRLEKDLGETRVAGLRDLERPPWKWPPFHAG